LQTSRPPLHVDLARQLTETLERLRADKELNQGVMARRFGISQPTLNRFEPREPEHNAPDARTVLPRRALRVIYSFLVGRSSEGVVGRADYRAALLLAKSVDAPGRERLKFP
jgi:hypothetical protein